VFKTIEKSYAYYLSECNKLKTYRKKWKELQPYPGSYQCTCYMENLKEWRIKLHAVEKALGLTDKEKEKL
jgi:hypothetical protein